jgi:hypothetical protein
MPEVLAHGQTKVAADFSLLAAAVNLARFGVLGLTRVAGPGGQWPPVDPQGNPQGR